MFRVSGFSRRTDMGFRRRKVRGPASRLIAVDKRPSAGDASLFLPAGRDVVGVEEGIIRNVGKWKWI